MLLGIILVPKLQARGIISQIIPMHEDQPLHNLRSNWVAGVLKTQPLGNNKLGYL